MKARTLEMIQVNNGGYTDVPLEWDGEEIKWGQLSILMTEVRLLEPVVKNDAWMNGALITIPPGSSTTVQSFTGARTYVEELIAGQGMWLGITPQGESYGYDPLTTYSLRTHKLEGSLVCGSGWVYCWINVGLQDFQFLELCWPRFEVDGTVTVLKENEPVSAPMFWGLHSLLTSQH